jgi:predicted enzyme related to lactoylglutathione lyase
MEAKSIVLATLVLVMSFMSCMSTDKTNTESASDEPKLDLKENNMKSYISMFEIPAVDISRAIQFYETLLDIKIEPMNIEGMHMGIWPYEGQAVPGVLIQAEGYKPSADGVTLFLKAGDNLQVALDRVEKNGGQIVVPKTAHADESGYFAIILDSEGNKIALNSPN